MLHSSTHKKAALPQEAYREKIFNMVPAISSGIDSRSDHNVSHCNNFHPLDLQN
jgi:hypothetical protein